MGDLVFVPSLSHSKLIIELNEKTNDALAHRGEKEGLNKTTLFNRAMQVYDHIMTAQENGEPISINGQSFTIK